MPMKISKLLYGTGNPAKLAAMRRWLGKLDIEVLGLGDMDSPPPAVEETGSSPLENAQAKARAYYAAYGVPVFSCDSGLYFDGVPDEVQPGVHVRNVGGRCLSDREMMDYYASLAVKYGDLTARYRNAICLILDEGQEYSSMADSLASKPFIITSVPHPTFREGFPLDSLSIDISCGKYYYDMLEHSVDVIAVEDGFTAFIKSFLKDNCE